MKKRGAFWDAVFAVGLAYVFALALANFAACEQWDRACLITGSSK